MDLTLSEKLLLIALDDEKGNFVSLGASMQFGLAGAVLMELSILRKIELRDKLVYINNRTLVNSKILNEAINLIAKSEKPRKLGRWISTLSSKAEKWKKQILQSLVQKNILVEKQKRFLGIIPYKRYPMINPGFENKLKDRLRNIISENASADDHELMLIGLIHSCDLSAELYKDRSERKVAKAKMKKMSENNQFSKVIDETQAAITAAIVASIAASAAVTAAVSS